ncbi:MAG TPA: hypothetical protein VGF06_00460 [Terriglobales bacterium]|jgi:hypothetical protein
MADVIYQNQNLNPLRKAVDWSAVWAGLFTFAAIWSVFGFLGYAIFPQNANNRDVALAIWSVILTIIAMFVAGRQTGRVAGLDLRADGMAHGMIMFGLSVVAAAVLTLSGSMLFTNLSGGPAMAANALPHASYLLTVFGGSGWATFIALFLGWLAAMLGASSSGPRRVAAPAPVRDMRPAA